MDRPSRWKAFWADQSVPAWRYGDEAYYQMYAAELRVLYHGLVPRRVLELGCGDGALYAHLRFGQSDYKGVDFSASMLQAFRHKFPLANVECHDGHTYRDGNKYDLIFSNGLVQYLDARMLQEHIANAATMMAAESVLVCGSVPWRTRRWGYYSGRLEKPCAKRSGVTYLKALRHVLADSVGYWYEPFDFCSLAARFGFSVEFFGSMVHLYRFHVVMRIRAPQSSLGRM